MVIISFLYFSRNHIRMVEWVVTGLGPTKQSLLRYDTTDHQAPEARARFTGDYLH